MKYLFKRGIETKSIFEKMKSQPKTMLATVAIAGVTLGFAGGLGVGEISTSIANNQFQSHHPTAAQEFNEQGMTPSGQGGQPGGDGQSMTPPRQGGQPGGDGQSMTPPRQGGQPGGSGQGMTPPEQGNTTDASNSSSDEINDLKKKIKKFSRRLKIITNSVGAVFLIYDIIGVFSEEQEALIGS